MASVFIDPSYYNFDVPILYLSAEENNNRLALRVEDHVLYIHQCIALGWVSLCIYVSLSFIFLYQLDRGDKAVWSFILPSFIAAQAVAGYLEYLKYARYEVYLHERCLKYALHRIIHYICLSATLCFITWKLDQDLDVKWCLIFTPMWFDVIVGVCLLLNSCPSTDTAEENTPLNNHIRMVLLRKVVVHFCVWGLQVVLISNKLDDNFSHWFWYTAFFIWTVAFVILAMKLLHMSIYFPLKCYALLLRFWEIFSWQQKFLAAEATVAIILLWAWVLIGVTIFTNVMAALHVVEQPGKPSNVLHRILYFSTLLLVASVAVIPFIVRILTWYALSEIVASVECDTQHLFMEPIGSSVVLKRASANEFERDSNSPEQPILGMGGTLQKLQAEKQQCDIEAHEENTCTETIDVGPCYICLTIEQPNAILMECKHGGMCYECAKGLILHSNQNCPICRETIMYILRIPNEALKVSETIGHSFRVTEGVVVKSMRTSETIANRLMLG